MTGLPCVLLGALGLVREVVHVQGVAITLCYDTVPL